MVGGRFVSLPDRDALRRLSSTLSKRLRLRLKLFERALPIVGAASVLIGAAAAATLSPQQVSWYRARLGLSAGNVLPSQVAPSNEYVYAQPVGAGLQSDPLAEAIVSWNRLKQSDRLLFNDYASFVIAHPGWPGELGFRKNAERAMAPETTPPAQAIAFFSRFPPLTPNGHLRYAEALRATGATGQANLEVRAAWAGGMLNPDDEARILSGFPGAITSDDHDKRMERLLWDNATGAALRQLPWTSAARQPMFRARIALKTKAPDAAMQAAALGPAAEQDAGYLRDYCGWLLSTGQWVTARVWLAKPRSFAAPPFDADDWLGTRLAFAKSAASDNQWQTAYDIASKADDAYPAGTVVRDRPYSERDTYTDLMWLAGTTALNRLGRPADAIPMFRAYAAGGKSPQVAAKGNYWAGRAAQAAGRAAEANSYYQLASVYYDQFYGQLAAERLGIAVPVPPPALPSSIAILERSQFENSEVVRAIKMLGQLGDWQNQTQFIRALSTGVSTDAELKLAAELSRDVGRPDLAVMVSRIARRDGGSDYVRSGFPEIPVPDPLRYRWTMIHAIMRQESQFDRQAVSRAGARGMMQLMPATAREWAGKLSLPYDYMRLTTDPGYNMQIGAAYFSMLLDRYAGNHVLAVAAYNAGPGNVAKMIAANGDPRLPGTDVVAWIEKIPLSETRGYVQHVLENAVVYDLLNPDKARMVAQNNRLSAYLGKLSAG